MVEFMMKFFSSETVSVLITVLMALLGGAMSILFTYKSKNKMDMYMMKNEGEEIDRVLQKIQIIYNQVGKEDNANEKNILNMMIDNVSELREYYVISKQQARRSFSASLFICFFGIFIYLLGIIAYVIFGKNISVISVIAGTVVEVIAGLFFWLYREATKQLGIYHKRLGSTEKYLIAYQLIGEVPEDKKYDEQRNFINYVLNDNQMSLKNDNGGNT